jgi:hypothetical protein
MRVWRTKGADIEYRVASLEFILAAAFYLVLQHPGEDRRMMQSDAAQNRNKEVNNCGKNESQMFQLKDWKEIMKEEPKH